MVVEGVIKTAPLSIVPWGKVPNSVKVFVCKFKDVTLLTEFGEPPRMVMVVEFIAMEEKWFPQRLIEFVLVSRT